MAVGQSGERVVTMTAAADAITGTKIVESMRWIGVTAGDDLVVDDSAGNIIWVAKAETNNFTDAITFGPQQFDGVVVDTIDSGTLYVYLA